MSKRYNEYMFLIVIITSSNLFEVITALQKTNCQTQFSLPRSSLTLIDEVTKFSEYILIKPGLTFKKLQIEVKADNTLDFRKPYILGKKLVLTLNDLTNSESYAGSSDRHWIPVNILLYKKHRPLFFDYATLSCQVGKKHFERELIYWRFMKFYYMLISVEGGSEIAIGCSPEDDQKKIRFASRGSQLHAGNAGSDIHTISIVLISVSVMILTLILLMVLFLIKKKKWCCHQTNNGNIYQDFNPRYMDMERKITSLSSQKVSPTPVLKMAPPIPPLPSIYQNSTVKCSPEDEEDESLSDIVLQEENQYVVMGNGLGLLPLVGSIYSQ